jgi:outer membrane protein assembly factor BamA
MRFATTVGFGGLLLAMLPLQVMANVKEESPATFSFVVDTIVVQGTRVTKPFIITREMTIQAGDTVTDAEIEENRKRIENLGLFTRVEIIPQVGAFDRTPLLKRNILMVRVTEEWYILPLPFWHKEGDDFNKITYGLQYLHRNFRGRNERIAASVWTGAQTGYQVSYSNPWFAGKGTWGCAADAYRTIRKVSNAEYRELDAELNTSGGRASVQRRFGLDTRFTAIVGFSRLRANYSDLMVSNQGFDDWVSTGIVFLSDRRDLYEYPSKGWFHLVNIYWDLLLNRPNSSTEMTSISGSLEIRHYRQLPLSMIACERGLIRLRNGLVPLYRRYLLGQDTDPSIRGWRGDAEEGEGLFLGSLELRRPLFNIRYFSWESAPVFRRYFRNLKYGLSAGLFLDLGQVWFEPGAASWKRFQAGWGAGLHFHLPYVEVIRLDAGWSSESRFQDARIGISSRVAF